MNILRLLLTTLFALLLAACGGRVELVAAVPEHEANEALAALATAGVMAEKVPGKEGQVGLRVEARQVARAVEVLNAQGLPRERFAGMGDVFRKEGLISSPLEERARYVYALSQELSGTLSRIDGVIAARVHVVLPERSPAGEETTPASAAVFIKHQAQANLDTVQPQIRRLVTNAIPGLTSERVSLVLVPSALPVAAPADVAGDELPWRAIALACGLLALAGLGGAGWLAWRHSRPGPASQVTATAAASEP